MELAFGQRSTRYISFVEPPLQTHALFLIAQRSERYTFHKCHYQQIYPILALCKAAETDIGVEVGNRTRFLPESGIGIWLEYCSCSCGAPPDLFVLG